MLPFRILLQLEIQGRLVDYEDELYGDTGFISNTAFNITGGNDRTGFFAGFSHKNEEGIVKRTGYEKTSVRLNLNHKISGSIKNRTEFELYKFFNR